MPNEPQHPEQPDPQHLPATDPALGDLGGEPDAPPLPIERRINIETQEEYQERQGRLSHLLEVARTSQNPYYLLEALQQAADQGLLYRDERGRFREEFLGYVHRLPEIDRNDILLLGNRFFHYRMDEARMRLAEMDREAWEAAQEPPEDPNVRLERILQEAEPLFQSPDPLEDIQQELRRIGWGGQIVPLLIIYLAATTRLLSKRPGMLPCHTQVNGPPGSGKNFALERVLALFPTEAYVKYDAGTPRVVVYDPASFKHRVVVFSEADSLPGVNDGDEDNSAASMVRTLLQNHEASYKVPVKDRTTGLYTIHTVVKEGPTVLLTTTVERISGEQMDSRLFALNIPDDPQQQQEALRAQADIELAGMVPTVEPKFVAFQEVLQERAPLSVVVPYVGQFFHLLRTQRHSEDSRLLRDAQRLLSLIKAVAIIRSGHRQRDAEGRIVATLEDYKTVFDWVDGMYTATMTEVTSKVEQVVQAVRELSWAKPNLSQVARHLKWNRGTAHRAIKIALKNGWLVNREDHHELPMRLEVGEPLPSRSGLPTVEQLQIRRTPVSGGRR